MNGVTFPDRSPHPALYEAKFLAQPVGIELLPPADSSRSLEATPQGTSETLPLRLRFTNRYGMSSLDHLTTEWRLQSSSAAARKVMAAAAAADTSTDDSSLPRGHLSPVLSRLPAGESRDVTVEVDRAALMETQGQGPGGGRQANKMREEIFLYVEARLAAESAWAPRGHLVARGCFSVTDLMMPAGELPLLLPPTPPPVLLPGGGVLDAVQRGGGDGGPISTAVPSQGFILYGEEDDSARSSAEVSPQGQL